MKTVEQIIEWIDDNIQFNLKCGKDAEEAENKVINSSKVISNRHFARSSVLEKLKTFIIKEDA